MPAASDGLRLGEAAWEAKYRVLPESHQSAHQGGVVVFGSGGSPVGDHERPPGGEMKSTKA